MTFKRGITGVEFYPNRRSLDRIRSLTEALERVDEAHVFWIVGRKQFQAGEGLEKIKRLILPHPDSSSIKTFEAALPDQMELRNQLREVTDRAIEQKIPVRWYPEFGGYSWWIADPNGKNAFVHLEMNLPYAHRDRRPSIRIYRKRHSETFAELLRVYEEIWKHSKEPDDAR